MSFDPRCKWTEIALGIYDDPGLSNGKGLILRPEERDPLQGSTTVDPNDPYFAINSIQLWPNMGAIVEKVGITTGWTFGEVIETCELQEVRFPNDPLIYYMFCSYTARMGAQGGDSGSIVMTNLAGDWADIVGQIYGVLDTLSFLTPWNSIAVIADNELGTLLDPVFP